VQNQTVDTAILSSIVALLAETELEVGKCALMANLRDQPTRIARDNHSWKAILLN